MLAIATALLITQAAQPAPAQPSQRPAPCTSEGHAQFDFFVGDWDVYQNGTDRQVATSKWERLYNGCGVRENWMPLQGGAGGSLNAYDPATGQWHQTWIGSGGGGHIEFTGGLTEGGVVLTGYWPGSGPNGENGLTRMTYSRAGEGAVRQHGEFSADHGVTWVTTFDLLYRPRSGD